ncbi:MULTISPECIES: hypothetical protein [Fredinandcohnia]|uniref:hypothetical protein n=1 Tax=Fredinandcohnia TaxID=2837501 RepID=UPI000C0C0B38|nr:hypothetical protein [Fredinandcohnia onubensis]
MDENKLIMGEIEEEAFVLTQFKHMTTQSVISKERLGAICDYLSRKVDSGENEHYITLNDQMPIRLNQAEMKELLDEFIEIRGKLN